DASLVVILQAQVEDIRVSGIDGHRVHAVGCVRVKSEDIVPVRAAVHAPCQTERALGVFSQIQSARIGGIHCHEYRTELHYEETAASLRADAIAPSCATIRAAGDSCLVDIVNAVDKIDPRRAA